MPRPDETRPRLGPGGRQTGRPAEPAPAADSRWTIAVPPTSRVRGRRRRPRTRARSDDRRRRDVDRAAPSDRRASRAVNAQRGDDHRRTGLTKNTTAGTANWARERSPGTRRGAAGEPAHGTVDGKRTSSAPGRVRADGEQRREGSRRDRRQPGSRVNQLDGRAAREPATKRADGQHHPAGREDARAPSRSDSRPPRAAARRTRRRRR